MVLSWFVLLLRLSARKRKSVRIFELCRGKEPPQNWKTTTANERVLFGNININIENRTSISTSNININIDINNTLITFKHLHLRICRACFNMSSTHGVTCTAYSSPSPIDAYKFHNMVCISY